MIAVAGGVQVEGLGRCFAQTVEHNRIYLSCPTVKGTFCYDCHFGSLSEMWGTYRASIPYVVAKRIDNSLVRRRDIHPGDGTVYALEREGWSNDLAKSCFPTVLTSLTEIVLNPKKSDSDLEKAMVGYLKVKVKRFPSTGEWHFYHDDEEWDFERCLHEITAVIQKKNGIIHRFDPTVVLDYFGSEANDIFKE